MDVCSSQVGSAPSYICDHRAVLARRILLFCSIVLLAAALSSALTTSTRDDGQDAVAPPVAAAAPPTARVTAALPDDATVSAQVGDVVELNVTADEPERVEIRDLGVDAVVGPGLPAKLLVVTDRAGEFAVTLRYSGREIGTLTVTDR